MIAEIGHFAMILALAAAIVQTIFPLYGAHKGNRPLMSLASPAAIAQLILIAIAFLALLHAYVTSDFSVKNVWENSHSAKPLLYKISGVWGNHEGSMLLWVLILVLFGALVARTTAARLSLPDENQTKQGSDGILSRAGDRGRSALA